MKKNTFKKIVFVITVILLICVIAFTVFMVVNQLSFNELSLRLSRQKITDIGVYKTIGFTAENTKVCVVDEMIYLINPYKVITYDRFGDMAGEKLNDFMNPIVAYNNELIILYDLDSAFYELYTNGMETKKYDSGVLSAVSVSKNNFISLIKAGHDGYAGEIITIDADNESSASVGYANRYPISTAVLHNKEHYAVVSLDTLDIYKTSVDIYSLYEKKTVAGMKIDGSYLMVKAVGNDSLMLVGDAGYLIYDSKLKLIDAQTAVVIEVAYGKKNTYVAYIRNGKNYLMSLDESGKEIFNQHVQFTIEGINAYQDKVVVFGSKKVEIYRDNGKLLEAVSIFSFTEDVFFMDNDIIVVVGNDDIVLYKYK